MVKLSEICFLINWLNDERYMYKELGLKVVFSYFCLILKYFKENATLNSGHFLFQLFLWYTLF